MNRTVSGLTIFCIAASVAACATGEGPPDDFPDAITFGSGADSGSGGLQEDTDTDGETDGPIPEEGQRWCTRAASATHTNSQGQASIPVTYPDSTSPEGCSCAPQETHEWLLARLVGNEIQVDSATHPLAPDDVLALRNNVYSDAGSVCTGLLPAGAMASNCNDGMAQGGALDSSPLTGFQHPGLYHGDRDGSQECIVSRTYQVDPDDCSFVDGDYGITRSKTGAYEIPQSTFDDFFDNPGCLYQESGRVDAVTGGYEFKRVGSGTLLHDLGLRTGDIPVLIDGLGLSTVDDAFAAYDAVRDNTSWTLTIRRGGQSIELDYVVN